MLVSDALYSKQAMSCRGCLNAEVRISRGSGRARVLAVLERRYCFFSRACALTGWSSRVKGLLVGVLDRGVVDGGVSLEIGSAGFEGFGSLVVVSSTGADGEY